MFNIENQKVKKDFKKRVTYAALALLSQLSLNIGSCVAAENTITEEESQKVVKVGIVEKYFDPNNNNTVKCPSGSDA